MPSCTGKLAESNENTGMKKFLKILPLLIVLAWNTGNAETRDSSQYSGKNKVADSCRSDSIEATAFCDGWMKGFLDASSYLELIDYGTEQSTTLEESKTRTAFDRAFPGASDWCIDEAITDEVIKKFRDQIAKFTSDIAFEQQFAQFLSLNWSCEEG